MTDEQISPELVLIDPELAERARAEMPLAAADVPWAVARLPAASSSGPPARLAPPASGFTIAATLWLFGAIAVAVTLMVELLPDRGPQPSLAPALARPAASRPAPVAPPAPPAAPAKPPAPKAHPPAAARPAAPPPAAQPPPTPKPKPQPKPKPKAKPQPQPRTPPPPPAAARPKPKPKPKPVPATPEPGTTPPPPTLRSPPPAPRTGFQPARVFAWAPQADASYYHVVIRRDGKLFYEAWPREARLEIPARFRFRPGAYTWRVEPGKGAREAKELGPPIVESSFTIPG